MGAVRLRPGFLAAGAEVLDDRGARHPSASPAPSRPCSSPRRRTAAASTPTAVNAPIEISEQLRYALEHAHRHRSGLGRLARPQAVGHRCRGLRRADRRQRGGVRLRSQPSVNGAWTYYHSRADRSGPSVGGSNIDTQTRPLGVLRATDHPCVVRLDARDEPPTDLAAPSPCSAPSTSPTDAAT